MLARPSYLVVVLCVFGICLLLRSMPRDDDAPPASPADVQQESGNSAAYSQIASEQLRKVKALVKGEKKPRDAYCTLLVSRHEDIWEEDRYFNATRLLIWQITKQSGIRDETGRDFIVMTTNTTAQWKLDVLREDGAIIKFVDDIPPPEGTPWHYRDVFTKLRAWSITGYDRVLLMDSDHMLRASIQQVWDHECSKPLPRVQQGKFLWTEAERKMESDWLTDPELETYLFAAQTDPWWPFDQTNGYFNSGFCLIRPSNTILNYMLKLLPETALYDPAYPDQNLLNHFFRRRGGPFPWAPLPYNMTTGIVIEDDGPFETNVSSIHGKFWYPTNQAKLKEFGWGLFSQLIDYWTAHGRPCW